ncbi:MAG: C45 family autoproteolytic acyltransferase/hydrolase [DPANN group archaeon]|nr:C45 family autoproteolytic acyltransferase/hydrolase [DPANN group archaeon]
MLYFRKVNPKGIPIHFFTRAFLDVEKVSELTKLAKMSNKMVGWSNLVVFGNKIFDLEITPKTFALVKGQKYLAHTNHVLSPKIIAQEKSHSRDSLWRLERANDFLKNNEFNFGLVKKILADHKHRPFSICCHEFEKQGETPYATLASVIANINKKELYVANGNPCKSRYERYCLIK